MARIHRVLFAMALAAAVTQSSHAEKKYSSGATDTEIKIGQTYPYSGPLSAYSTMARTEAAVFAKLNAEGGLGGRKVNLISLDDGYNPPKTVEQTRRLVEQEEVLLLFNTLGTPTNMSVIKYLNQRHVPQLLVSTGASAFGDYRSYPWTLGFWPTYPTEAQAFVRYITKNLPQAKVGVLYPNLDSGRDFVRGVHEAFGTQTEKFVVKEVAYDDSQPKVDSEVISLQSAESTCSCASPLRRPLLRRSAKRAHLDGNRLSSSVRSPLRSKAS